MTTTRTRRPLWIPALFALCLLASLTGCNEYIGGSWGQLSPDRNDVTKVQKGWGTRRVINQIGEPLHVDHGRNVGIGWQEWIYPTGSVVFYRMQVAAVHVRHRGNEDLAKQLRKADEATEPEMDTYGRTVNLGNTRRLEGISGTWAQDGPE